MMKRLLASLTVAFAGLTAHAEPPVLPTEVDESSFDLLLEESPFLRLVGGTNSLILTGLALIDDRVVATLHDSDSQVTHLVTEGVPNREGWQLVSIKGDQNNLESMLVQVQRGAGDVVPVRYNKAPARPLTGRPKIKTKLSKDQEADIAAAAKNPKRGMRGDGLRDNDMTPELVSKLKKLSESQRINLGRKVMDMRNQGMSNDQRKEFYLREVDKAVGKR